MEDNPFTIDDINRLALNQPIVHAALTLVWQGRLTMDQALIAMVMALAAELDDSKKQTLDLLQRWPGPGPAYP